MTTISTIITDALRESNRIAAGATPPAALVTEGVTLFNRIMASVLGWEVGGTLKQWPVGITGYVDPPAEAVANVWAYPTANSMLACNLSSAQTIYLPQQPADGTRIGVQDLQGNFATYNLTLNGNGRRIEGAATLTLSTNSLNRQWFFRADTGNWVRVATLDDSDDFPFPLEFEDWFIFMLTLRFAPRLGPAMPDATIAAMKRAQSQFIARYLQNDPLKRDPTITPVFMSQQSFGTSLFDPDELLN